MNLNCLVGMHRWKGCKCAVCGRERDKDHDWTAFAPNHLGWRTIPVQGCKCQSCGKIRHEAHQFCNCKCVLCGYIRDEQHYWCGCKCHECGLTRDGDEVLHFWDDDCERCSSCGKTRPGAHDWSTDCEQCAKCGMERAPDSHNWSHCKCVQCGRARRTDHKWDGCRCDRCGKIRDNAHHYAGGICQKCGYNPEMSWVEFDYERSLKPQIPSGFILHRFTPGTNSSPTWIQAEDVVKELLPIYLQAQGRVVFDLYQVCHPSREQQFFGQKAIDTLAEGLTQLSKKTTGIDNVCVALVGDTPLSATLTYSVRKWSYPVTVITILPSDWKAYYETCHPQQPKSNFWLMSEKEALIRARAHRIWKQSGRDYGKLILTIERLCRELEDHNPFDPDSHMIVGRAYADNTPERDMAKAMKHFRAALSMDPNHDYARECVEGRRW